MAPVRLRCPGCDAIVRVREDERRRQTPCPFCGESIPIGSSGNAPASGTDRPRRSPSRPTREAQTADEEPRGRRTTTAEGRHSSGRSPERRKSQQPKRTGRGASHHVVWIVGISIAASFLMAGVAAIVYVVRQDATSEQGEQTVAQVEPKGDDLNQPAAGPADNAAERGGVEVKPVPAPPPFPGGQPQDEIPGQAPGANPPPADEPFAAPPAVVAAPEQPAEPPPGQAQPGQAPVDPQLGGRLHYAWKSGRDYVFNFRVEAEDGTENRTITGTCRYSVGQAGPVVNPDEPQVGTGTGFVVTADGVLATCAHVVEGAEKIEVALGNKKYLASVIAVDPPHDLALIRIAAKGLPILKLANSDQVELAQEIRAVGYPLSDILGNNVKITKGTVAGLNQDEERGRLFQVDAAINPGNSGGPVVDETGSVVGIASSKLTGPAVSKVGFAVPSNELGRLMQEHKLKSTAAAKRAALPGPQLAREVIPAIAMITVTLDPNHRDQIVLNYTGQYTQTSRSDRPGVFSAPRTTQSDRGRLVIDRFGQVIQLDSDESLPYLLGHLPSLVIDPLSSTGRNQWGFEHEITVNRIEREQNQPGGLPFGPPRMRSRMPMIPRGRFGPPNPFGADNDRERVIQIPALERARFRVTGQNGKLVEIAKTYHLETRDGGEHSLKMDGTGTIQFDSQLGVPRQLSYQAKLARQQDGVLVTVPIRFSANLQNPDEKPIEVPGQIPGNF